ncbi:LytR family transcriptional regulator [Kineosporiaceae bacterium B12]|nr:LytR family transcriptional regulator [Kineococcus rubinsiae]
MLRQRVVFAVVVLAVLAAGTVGALTWTGRWSPGTPAAATPTPAPSCAVAAPPPLSAPPEVSVSVLNGTTRRGLAGTVAAELRTRGFVVTRTANADVAAGPVTASVRYPPALLAQARTVAARVPDVQLAEDPALAGVEVTLGDGYAQLLAEDALVAPAPPPAAPLPGC